MATIAEQRDAIVAALNAVGGITVTGHAVTNNLRPGDGWVTVSRVAPSDFTASAATFNVVVSLGPNAVTADTLLDTLAVQLIDAITDMGGAMGVYAEPLLLVADGTQPGNVYAVQLVLTLEVTR